MSTDEVAMPKKSRSKLVRELRDCICSIMWDIEELKNMEKQEEYMSKFLVFLGEEWGDLIELYEKLMSTKMKLRIEDMNKQMEAVMNDDWFTDKKEMKQEIADKAEATEESLDDLFS